MTEVITNTANYFPGGPRGADNEDRKLFVGGLSWDTTEDDLVQYFSQFGAITNVSIKYNALTGNPRGFGFITFATDGSIDAVLCGGPHSLKNKVIDPRKAKTRPNCKKIFVGGLDSNMAEEEIRDYFSRFGAVEGVELPFDKTRGRRREFGFVIFESEESADAACQESKQAIGGRDCDIKKAQPQNQSQNQRRGGGNPGGYQQPPPPMQDAFGAGFGSGWGQRGDEYSNGMPSAAAAGGWRDSRGSNGGRSGGGGGGRYHRGRVYTGSAFNGGGHNFNYQ